MSSIGGSRGMDFASMNFANSMLNGSSLFGTVGISMVNGVKVTGVNLLQNDEISVTLRHTITTAGDARSLPGSITIMAMRVPMNLRDLMSMAAAAAAAAVSNKTAANNSNSNNMNIMKTMQEYGPAAAAAAAAAAGAGNATSSMNNFNPWAFLKNIQIGSSNIVNADWSIPQSVTMGLVSNSNNNKPFSSQTADFIIVTVIPFTGRSSPAK